MSSATRKESRMKIELSKEERALIADALFLSAQGNYKAMREWNDRRTAKNASEKTRKDCLFWAEDCKRVGDMKTALAERIVGEVEAIAMQLEDECSRCGSWPHGEGSCG